MTEELTRRQHYVPQFYLRNFLDNSQTLYGYSRVNSMHFCILKSDNDSFITSDFPILYDPFKKRDMPLFKTIFFSISPKYAIIYSQSNDAKRYRNRIRDLSNKGDISLKCPLKRILSIHSFGDN